jgi:hypothetical protein
MKIKLLIKFLVVVFFFFASVTCDKLCGLGFVHCPGTSECCPTASPYYCKQDDNCYSSQSEARQHCSNDDQIVHCE